MSTLWSKGTQATDLVEDFTVGNDRVLDMRLAKYDVTGSKAHIKMLESIGLLEQDELATLTAALDQILVEIEEGTFVLWLPLLMLRPFLIFHGSAVLPLR